MSKAHRPDYQCDSCSFELWHPVAGFEHSVLGLYDDARFPGRCLLVLREHHEDLARIPQRLLHGFVDEAASASLAIQAVTRAVRINYAVLGNRIPHAHFHLIPRHKDLDPILSRPPWEHPDEKRSLSKKQLRGLVHDLRAELDGSDSRS